MRQLGVVAQEFVEKLRRQRLASRLHALGPRATFEFIEQVRAEVPPLFRGDVEWILEEYARLDPAVLKALGADRPFHPHFTPFQDAEMPRIRTIKPEFFTSEQVTGCSIPARMLFAGMWCFCDDQGVHPDSPKRLKMEIFPADDMTATDIGQLIDELVAVGLVARFTVDDQSFLFVTGWAKHQRIDRPNFRFPAPPFDDGSTTHRRKLDEGSLSDQGAIDVQSPPERKGREKERRGEGKKKEEDVGARKSAAPPNGGYAFLGRIIKLRARELEEWRSSFLAIPDIVAELRAIDAKLADSPPKNGKWYGQVGGWLRSKNERLLAEAKTPKQSNGGFVPLGVGG